MSEFELKIIEVKQNIFEENENSANELREYLKKEKTFMVNLMASPVQERLQYCYVQLKCLKMK